MKGGADKARQ